MSQVVGLVPARSGSKGIVGKNFRQLGGLSLMARAARVARDVCDQVVISSDIPVAEQQDAVRMACRMRFIHRPGHLAQDDTPMYDVVKHAVKTLKLADDDIVVLLQPTAVFRKPDHITKAVQMLRETGADSVVSVVPLPLTHSPSLQCVLSGEHLRPALFRHFSCSVTDWRHLPARRQAAEQTYKRDGTVYAFYVKTLKSGTLYGSDVRPFILAPSETCELDTELDWEAVQARWSAQHG
jgi:CMP-N,N'-diacetyllegionaminic acid synthase